MLVTLTIGFKVNPVFLGLIRTRYMAYILYRLLKKFDGVFNCVLNVKHVTIVTSHKNVINVDTRLDV